LAKAGAFFVQVQVMPIGLLHSGVWHSPGFWAEFPILIVVFAVCIGNGKAEAGYIGNDLEIIASVRFFVDLGWIWYCAGSVARESAMLHYVHSSKGRKEQAMCGRYYIDEETAREIRNVVREVDERLQREKLGYDVYPAKQAPVLLKKGNKLTAAWQRWGYPGFFGSKVIFNARAESVMEKRMFHEGICCRRVIVPASWFYEWNRSKEKITFQRTDSQVMFMAGFYSSFEDGDRFVILTTQANASVRGVHDRMPLILERDQLKEWVLNDRAAKRILGQRPVLLKKLAEYEQQTLF